MERRSFFGALAAAIAALFAKPLAAEALTRVDMLDGYAMVDADNRVAEFIATREYAPGWTFVPRVDQRPTLRWATYARPTPDTAPWWLQTFGEPRQWEFHAFREDASYVLTTSHVGDDWVDIRSVSAFFVPNAR